jgi:hypothetical protein
MAGQQDFAAKIAGRDVVASGSLTLSLGDDAFFLRLGELELNLAFERTSDGKMDVRGEVESPTRIFLHLLNFTSALGNFYSAEIGAIDNRKLHLALFVEASEGDKPELHLLVGGGGGSWPINLTFQKTRILRGK